jgi:hypothetical protein
MKNDRQKNPIDRDRGAERRESGDILHDPWACYEDGDAFCETDETEFHDADCGCCCCC